MAQSKGEKWIRLLRAYGPSSENEGQQAEHVDKLSSRLGVSKLAFPHPAASLLAECFPRDSGRFRNVLLTGTAGDGKTSLCLDAVQSMTGHSAHGTDGVQKITVATDAGGRDVTFIYDVTAWKKKTGGQLNKEHVALLERMAASAYVGTTEFFALAVNDGQMHELFRALPEDAPALVRRLEADLIALHARKEQDCGERLRLINLSLIPSELIMELCLGAVLDRDEWRCLADEATNPLFAPASSLSRNYRALNTPPFRAKLLVLARIADAANHHLPIRGTLCLLSNALLGHPDARDRLIRPGDEAATLLQSHSAHKAALHRTVFGDNLSAGSRQKREIYKFLSMLHVGEETTNDLDELLIFGVRDELLKASYDDLVSPDPNEQRDPDFESLLKNYIRGDMSPEETDTFLALLAAERRRVFLHATPEQVEKYGLWKTTVFHHAREYLDQVLKPLSEGKQAVRLHLRKLATGLNRVWVGLLLGENASEVHLATGLDLTTAAISDIHLAQLDLDSTPPGMTIARSGSGRIPNVVLSAGSRTFGFALTLPRFEFLCRVADGAMPSSFSRESWIDFMTLKQQCLRALELKANPRSLQLIEIRDAGALQKRSIHLAEQ